MTLLSTVRSPADLKRLAPEQLPLLAAEVRDLMVEAVSRTGGHLGPSLGVVETTLALHRVFDSPRDKVVWDTGHQAYVHKILTGRAELFTTLRRKGGLSGYPSRAESEHDRVGPEHVVGPVVGWAQVEQPRDGALLPVRRLGRQHLGRPARRDPVVGPGRARHHVQESARPAEDRGMSGGTPDGGAVHADQPQDRSGTSATGGATTAAPAPTDDVGEHRAALRAAVTALRAPEAAKRAPAPTTSVYGRAARAVPDDVHTGASREVLASRFRSVETSALMPGTTMVLAVTPTRGAVAPELLASLQRIVDGGAVGLVLGPAVPRHVADRSRPLTVPLRDDDALAQEWALVALGPQRRVAFLAQRQAGTADLWSWLTTRDPVAVERAGTAILERVPFLKLRVPPLAR